MLLLVAGLVVFLGTHAFTMNRSSREALIGRLGEGGYKGVYSLASLVGFVMIVWGFSAYRETGWVNVWFPPFWLGHLALLLTLPIFVLLIAAYAPGGSRRR